MHGDIRQAPRPAYYRRLTVSSNEAVFGQAGSGAVRIIKARENNWIRCEDFSIYCAAYGD
jgi:hypothetical protein